MMFNKYMIVTSTGEDIREPETLARLLRGADIPASLIRGGGVLDVLDHAAATTGAGGKLALDLTGAWSGASPDRAGAEKDAAAAGGESSGPAIAQDGMAPLLPMPDGIEAAGGINSWDTSLFPEWGIIIMYAAPGAETDTGAFIDANGLKNTVIAVLADEMTAGLTPAELLWIAAANSDPARDASLHGRTLVIDARTKLPGREGNPARFPNVVASSQRTVDLVDSRWSEYGLGGFIPSPSRRYRRLLMSDKAEI
jgi:4-hydroxy-3-polyprenylbenzoate decarboxylase